MIENYFHGNGWFGTFERKKKKRQSSSWKALAIIVQLFVTKFETWKKKAPQKLVLFFFVSTCFHRKIIHKTLRLQMQVQKLLFCVISSSLFYSNLGWLFRMREMRLLNFGTEFTLFCAFECKKKTTPWTSLFDFFRSKAWTRVFEN